MKVIIANHGCTIQWDGVYYFALPNYPNISAWELRNLILFVAYEKAHARETVIECEDASIKQLVDQALMHPESVMSTEKTETIPGHPDCADCKQGRCHTDFLCHTASIENAKSILSCGSILSAVKARNMTGIELSMEKRNAAGDPPDYFDHVMFTWGNCQAGDRLVMERLLDRSPTPDDLSSGFQPGVRFFFRYDAVIQNPNVIFDGYHPAKVKDGIRLDAYLFACVIPENLKSQFVSLVPNELSNRVHYLKNDCSDIWSWSEKNFNFALDIL